jgi:hypothetical protein
LGHGLIGPRPAWQRLGLTAAGLLVIFLHWPSLGA